MHINSLDLSSGKVLVFGDVMLDLYWQGSTSRISPEAPVPVVLFKDSRAVLGGAANVAANIKALQVEVALGGAVGEDEDASTMKHLLAEQAIASQLFSVREVPTTKKLRIMSRHQQLLRIDFEKNSLPSSLDLKALWEKTIKPSLETLLVDTKVIVLSDYLKGLRVFFPRIIALAQEKEIPVIIDPKGNDYSPYQGATLLTPNLSEFRMIAEQYGYDKEACSSNEQAIAQELMHKLNLKGLLITKSEKGMTLYLTDGTVYNQNTFAEEVFDVTGAGDTVIATLAATLSAGIDFKEACYLANKAAGISVSKLGTSTVSLEELEDSITAISKDYGASTLNQVKQKVEAAKAKGETIVFTNGCFDIMHRGHLSYLKRAKELGNRLVVGVNSDASVKRLKGNSRPINSAPDRMMMLAALKDVDWVVEFEEDTPLNLIKTLMPDILVKGGDYKVEEIVGYQEVIANGGKVQTINFVDNYSTTNTINKIASLNSKKD